MENKTFLKELIANKEHVEEIIEQELEAHRKYVKASEAAILLDEKRQREMQKDLASFLWNEASLEALEKAIKKLLKFQEKYKVNYEGDSLELLIQNKEKCSQALEYIKSKYDF